MAKLLQQRPSSPSFGLFTITIRGPKDGTAVSQSPDHDNDCQMKNYREKDREYPFEDHTESDRISTQFEEWGIPIRGHAVVWSIFGKNPDWFDTNPTLEELYFRVDDIVNRYKGLENTYTRIFDCISYQLGHSLVCTCLHMFVHSCTSLYISIYPCTSLYILVHLCISLCILVHLCTSLNLTQ